MHELVTTSDLRTWCMYSRLLDGSMYGFGATFFWNSTCIYVLVQVRLAGNNTLSNVGRLEIYYNDTWGTVCARGFDDRDARVACYMLGFRYDVVISAFWKLCNADSLHATEFVIMLTCVQEIRQISEQPRRRYRTNLAWRSVLYWLRVVLSGMWT